MEDTIICVATGLGWSHQYDWGTLEVAVPNLGGFYTSIRPHCNLVYIAAYAKAEMAKRGWCVRVAHDTAASMQAFSIDEPMPNTHWYDFDRSCPVSEAEAVLRCIAEALQSNSPFGETSA